MVQSGAVESPNNDWQTKQFYEGFHKKVLFRLGEMLKTLKQGDNPESRQQMQFHCQYLFDLGKEPKLRGWLELTATAKQTIGTNVNPFEGSTRLIIKEVKEAVEIVLAGEASSISVPKSLRELANLSVAKLGEIDRICREDKSQIEQAQDTVSSDLWSSQVTTSTDEETREKSKEQFEQAQVADNPSATPAPQTPVKDEAINPDDLATIFLQDFPEHPEFGSDQTEMEEILPEKLFEEQSIEELAPEPGLEELEELFEEQSIEELAPESNLEELEKLFGEQENRIDLTQPTVFIENEDPLGDLEGIGLLFKEESVTSNNKQETKEQTWINPLEIGFFSELEDELEETIDVREKREQNNPTGSARNTDFENVFEVELNEEEKLNLDIFEQKADREEFNELEDLEDFSIILKNDQGGGKEEDSLENSPNFHSMQPREDDDDEYLETNIAVLAQLSPEAEGGGLIPQTGEIVFYEQLEDLEALISRLVVADARGSFEQLEKILRETYDRKAYLQEEIRGEEEESEDEQSIFDDLEGLLGQGEQQGVLQATAKPAVGKTRTSQAGGSKFEQTMRVPIKQLDSLNNLIGEVVVKRNRLEENQDRLRNFLDNLLTHVQNLGELGGRMKDLYERSLLEGSLLASRNHYQGFGGAGYNSSNRNASRVHEGFGALEIDQFTDFHLITIEMLESIVRVREATSDIEFIVDETEQLGQTMRQVATQLQENMNKSRMVPFSHLLDAMGLVRAVRRVADDLDKQVELKVEGREVLIDKMLLENLKDPMTHLVNNSISHGIETPEVRKVKGKSPVGKLTIRAFLQANQTVITVSDDGAGINTEKVKNKAIEKGLVSKNQAKTLSNAEVYELVFRPGFSTKDQADQFAGRGVGLDVVRTNLNSIRGTVSIDSSLGKGTNFVLRLPLTMSICKALPCLSNNVKIAFPMDAVEDIFQDYPREEMELTEDGRHFIKWHDNKLEVHSLTRLLTYNRQQNRSAYGNKKGDTASIVILGGAGEHLAIEVDLVVKEEEIVIKQIEGPIPKPIGIAGATVLGDGTVMPIGDVLELIKLAGQEKTKSAELIPEPMEEQVSRQPTALVVDDSIAVRELLSLSLHKAGYRVEQARDGQEGWDKLRSGLHCDIIFCDIEMPRMNGLELLSRIQTDERLANLPLTLLTSRGAEKHRRVAAELGASGYLTKPYTERELLDAAEKMLRGETWLLSGEKAKVGESETTKPTVPDQTDSSESADEQKTQDTAGRVRMVKSIPSVLIIDDSVVMREMLSMTFKKAGYKIEQARDGQDALNKLQSGLECDLMLCDIEMPRMTGLELLSHLQKDEKLSSIPVAMVTSRGTEKHRRSAAALGAKAYFTKPYLENELLGSAQLLMQGVSLLPEASNT